jgi:UDP-N-acetylglucosamine--N-acetylmuramyl-(pentapeptide) pyrophosphoryl-undecaprenol N-acetylglucosamine transferase
MSHPHSPPAVPRAEGGGGRRIVVTGGGTGGHVYPALAMARALVARGHHVDYLGDPGRLEGRVVPGELPFYAVPAVQFPRAGLLAKARFGLGLLRAVVASRALLRRLGAEAVLGVGGYISAPAVLAGWTLGLPTAVHEANVTPGLANRLCARVADLVLLTYAATADKLPGRAPRERVGCPVNPAVAQGDAHAAAARYGLRAGAPTVVVVGGSLGAQTLNDLGVALARLPGRAFQLALVTGPKYEAATRAALDGVDPGPGLAIVGYEDRMPDAYALASLVLCRAGSSTLAELTVAGKPSVLVPSPNVTDNHQEGNARGLEAVGAARVLLEKGLDLPAAAAEVAALVADRAALDAMAGAARGAAVEGTAERVADLMEGLLRGR